MTKLPAPEQWVLHRMNEMEVAEMIEEYIDFVDGKGKSVRLPSIFVRHFRQRFDDVCPTVVSIATLPIVLADGVLLAPDGLDPDRGIAFKIQPELREVLPRREDCTDEAVRAAMEYLTDEWLCDVAADYAGKCTLISAALSMIERSLFDQRPCYFVTAGRRGGGKTTTLIMLIMAVTGIWPAAAAWSTNEEERRKALLSYFLYGVTYILWDNIARGSQIYCPHIEKSCTAAFYADRRLGVSEMVATAASVIHCFTGNNIGPRGDLASRSLQVRLVVDRTDPENRAFKHPDPVGWTEDNRAEILRALYTLLLGNPALRLPRNAVMHTRFKMWYRVVGAAVEHAARLVKKDATDPVKRETADQETREKMDRIAAQQDVDFRKLFLVQEAEGDDDSVSLSSALEVMKRRWVKFRAEHVADLINRVGREGANDGILTPEMKRDSIVLRDFLFGPVPANFVATPRSIGNRLKAHRDEPVRHGGRRWSYAGKQTLTTTSWSTSSTSSSTTTSPTEPDKTRRGLQVLLALRGLLYRWPFTLPPIPLPPPRAREAPNKSPQSPQSPQTTSHDRSSPRRQF